MAEHIIKRFDEELTKLRYRLVKMGTLVQQQIEMALEALQTNNHEIARIVVEMDDKVDKLDMKIDKQCLRIFALHQPVAMDLRMVLSAVKINDSMEILGDLATNIAQNVLNTNLQPGLLSETTFIEMSDKLKKMLTKLLDSFVYLNAELALEVIKLSPEIDRLFSDNFDKLTNLIVRDHSILKSVSYLFDTNRNLQYISDQSVSIAGELIFLVEAKVIRHQNPEDLGMIERTNFNNE